MVARLRQKRKLKEIGDYETDLLHDEGPANNSITLTDGPTSAKAKIKEGCEVVTAPWPRNRQSRVAHPS
jgi:hypothetical protein